MRRSHGNVDKIDGEDGIDVVTHTHRSKDCTRIIRGKTMRILEQHQFRLHANLHTNQLFGKFGVQSRRFVFSTRLKTGVTDGKKKVMYHGRWIYMHYAHG
eukprot:140187_1